MLLYTIAGSLPLLLICALLSIAADAPLLSDFQPLSLPPRAPQTTAILAAIALAGGFLVKLPIYLVHL